MLRPFIPNPFVLRHHPASKVSAAFTSDDWPVPGKNIAHTRYIPETAPETAPLKGQIRWSLDLVESTDSAPAVVDGVVYVGGFFKIHAIEAETGRMIWETRAIGPVHSSPAIAGSLLFFGQLDGRVIALDRSTGKRKW